MVRFSTLDKAGKEISVKVISNADISRCPMVILMPEHYNDDGSCRCSEPTCEYSKCSRKKWDGEIYCKTHCYTMGLR